MMVKPYTPCSCATRGDAHAYKESADIDVCVQRELLTTLQIGLGGKAICLGHDSALFFCD